MVLPSRRCSAGGCSGQRCTFTVRFENELDLDDLEDVSWKEVAVPMAESAGEPAILHRLDELPLVRAPRGTQPVNRKMACGACAAVFG